MWLVVMAYPVRNGHDGRSRMGTSGLGVPAPKPECKWQLEGRREAQAGCGSERGINFRAGRFSRAGFFRPLSSIREVEVFLEDPHAVYVTVRELDYQTYYWLDKVQPAEPWSPGFQNTFSWPSQPVLQQLTPKVDLYDLGVLVRLDAESPSSLERVAPALLFHQDAPSVVTGYFFTFKTGEDARLFATIRQESTGQEMDSQTFRRKRAGRPFTIHWEAKEADPGPYILTLSGFSLSTNQTLSQEIHFYHQPAVNP